MTTEKFCQHAIVEVMGHQTYAGLVTEQTIGGASFIRVDVPEVDGRPAFTKLLGASSIYAITPVSEEVARLRARSLGRAPLSVYDLPEDVREKLRQPALTHAPSDEDEFMHQDSGIDDE